ncbi:MAG: nuclear transport factor 2 family protein [Acidobacteriota bacterium]|nr:nuclear transport factor 2 family protein [Acidobacteriota bacterium]MDQ3420398.1 nuclear transport factor 2 family protein [Acidobacteriota bacterium]
MDVRIPAVAGRDSIVAAYGMEFERRRLFPRIALIPESVVVVGMIAIERGRYDETLASRDESLRVREIGKYVSVARRGDDGRWRLATSIFNRDAPP